MPDSSSSGEAQEADAKALAELDHPLHYINSTFKEQRPTNPDERQAYLYDRRMIEDLISEYNYRVDSSLAKSPDYGVLDSLFIDDAVVAFPHGKHLGNAGLGEWLLSPVSAFHRMSVSEPLSLLRYLIIDTCLQHLSSNHSIKFESSTVAYGRSTWQSTAGFHATDIGQVFFTGGYYYWTFRKVDEEWKISYLVLDMTWNSGEFPGKPAK